MKWDSKKRTKKCINFDVLFMFFLRLLERDAVTDLPLAGVVGKHRNSARFKSMRNTFVITDDDSWEFISGGEYCVIN